MKAGFACAIVSVFCFATLARANSEPTALYDTRSLGLAGAGVAVVDSASGVYLNTAALAHTKKFSASIVASPMYAEQTSPFPAGATTKPSTATAAAPLSLLSAGYRVHDNVAVGLALFLTAGTGATYPKVPYYGNNDITLGAYAGEVQIPVAFNLMDNLQVGVAYRITRATVIIKQPVETAPGSGVYMHTESTQTGTNFAGLQAGVMYQPTDRLRLGLNYRSRVTVQTDGDFKIDGAVVSQQEAEFATPHAFRLGAAYSITSAVRVIGDLKYMMYHNSHPASATNTVAWKDVFGASLGGEYDLTEKVPLRLGVYATPSATPKNSNLLGYVPPPGVMCGISAGAGYMMEDFDFQFGVSGFKNLGGKVESTNPAIFNGEYHMGGVVASIGVNYRI